MRRLSDEQKMVEQSPPGPLRGWRAGLPTVRKTFATYRDGSKERRIIVVLYPSGRIGFRLEGLRGDEESVTAAWCYEQAVKARVAATPKKRRGT